MGGGSAKDPETGITLGSSWAQLSRVWDERMDEMHLTLFHSVLNRAHWKRLKNSISSAAWYAFSRARDCTTFMLHDLTDFYIERVTAHCIKINDHLCFHKCWPNSKTKLQLKHLWKQGVPLVFQGPCAAYSAYREDRLWLFYLRSVRGKHESYVWTTPFNYTLVL